MSSPATQDDIARLAYDLWIERGRPLGSPELDWERAERLLNLRFPAADISGDTQKEAPYAESVPLPDQPTQVMVRGTSSRAVKGAIQRRTRKPRATSGARPAT